MDAERRNIAFWRAATIATWAVYLLVAAAALGVGVYLLLT